MTRQELSHRAGVSIGQIYKLEKGRSNCPRTQTLSALRTALATPRTVVCSFCSSHDTEVRWLVKSPKDAGVFICDHCIRRSVALLAKVGRRNACGSIGHSLSLVRD